jgi:hypothetical protein
MTTAFVAPVAVVVAVDPGNDPGVVIGKAVRCNAIPILNGWPAAVGPG